MGGAVGARAEVIAPVPDGPGSPVTHDSVLLRDVAFEAGTLPEVRLAYETVGRLNRDASNVVLIAHALTGDAHTTSGGTGEQPGWWEDIVGPGRAIDTDRFFVICSHVVGGCTGSTGPTDLAPDGAPWGRRFPRVSIRDMARLDLALLDHLGIARVHAVIGGSMGGARALETALEAPERIERLVVLAAPAFSEADQIGWAHAQLGAIALDPHYAGGDYLARGTFPTHGLALARQIAHLTYRSDAELNTRFHRSENPALHQRPEDSAPRRSDAAYYRVESYLDHHGRKLVDRFDAQSYVLLTEALSNHDVRRGRVADPTRPAALTEALAAWTGPSLVISLSSDRLYPPQQVQRLADALPGPVRYAELPSAVGHDGFLLEHAAIGVELAAFLDASRVGLRAA